MITVSESSDVPRMHSIQPYGTDGGPSARGSTQPFTQSHAALCKSRYSLGRSGGVGIARRDRAYPFSQIILENQGMVYNLAYRILGDPELASSATEDAFVRALQAFPGRRGTPPKLWVMRIVVTICQDKLRPLPMQDSDCRSPSPGDHPMESSAVLFDRQTSIDHAQALLNTLPPDQRVAIVLSDVEGLSYREIADVTGTSVDMIRSRLSRGRAALRNALLARGELSPAVQT